MAQQAGHRHNMDPQRRLLQSRPTHVAKGDTTLLLWASRRAIATTRIRNDIWSGHRWFEGQWTGRHLSFPPHEAAAHATENAREAGYADGCDQRTHHGQETRHGLLHLAAI